MELKATTEETETSETKVGETKGKSGAIHSGLHPKDGPLMHGPSEALTYSILRSSYTFDGLR